MEEAYLLISKSDVVVRKTLSHLVQDVWDWGKCERGLWQELASPHASSCSPSGLSSCLVYYVRDDSVNSALLMVLVCGLEGAELLRCHAIAGRAGNYFCAVMVAVAAAPEPTASCS